MIAAPIAQTEQNKLALHRAITHYEAALQAAFPSGSPAHVSLQWDEARRQAKPDTAQTAPLPVQSGWISIEDRLPKRGQVIIVPRLNSTPFCGKYDPLGGQHRCLDRCLGKWWEFSRWMPMPDVEGARDV